MDDDELVGIAILALIAFVVLAFIFGPFILIWCISVLWGVPPVYDLLHWFAGAVFIVLFLVSWTRK